MRKALVVVDMQVDFTTGALANEEAVKVIPAIAKKVEAALNSGADVYFTRDTHYDNYMSTEEGKNLPVPHCIKDTAGWEIVPELKALSEKNGVVIVDKPVFGSVSLGETLKETAAYDEVELVGVCTDICVISNAMIVRAFLPNTHVKVDASCCAGITVESHLNALEAMKMCQVEVINLN
ncbi:MAG: cysteine hydrolase [Lachnospiraceae bacterium]|nr:cysteine hydrolase [Lachnospiraceae bacterium]